MHTFQMSTIKVLHVIARMNVGGTARYVGGLVKNIPESALATGYVQGEEIEDSIVGELGAFRVPHLGRKISLTNDLKAFFELRRIIRKINPEIVHTHTFKAGLLGRLVPGNHKKIHTFHGHLFDDQSFSKSQKILITIAERFLARRTDTLVSVGKRVGSELRESGIGRRRKWVSIPPGVNPLPKVEKGKARELLDLNPDAFLVGWMARVTTVKNPKMLVEVAKQLPNVQFVMAGGGDLYEEISSSAPLNLRVIGWTDASLFWSSVDIALSTSDNEGMPIALIEAQLSSLPVVATDVGSNSEVIDNGNTGIIVSNDLNQLVQAVEQLIQTVDLLDQMSRSSKPWAMEQFSIAKLLQRHEDMYATLVSERG
jgi:glycosyltransferase involved in cell wall biosynthesis